MSIFDSICWSFGLFILLCLGMGLLGYLLFLVIKSISDIIDWYKDKKEEWRERRREKKKKSLTKIGRVIRKEIDEKTGSMTVTVECNPEVAELICKYMEEV